VVCKLALGADEVEQIVLSIDIDLEMIDKFPERLFLFFITHLFLGN